MVLGRLSRTLKPPQLILLLKASIRPLIQLRAAAGIELESLTDAPAELLDDQDERIEIMMFPDQNTPLLKKENINSPSRLLTATYAFKIINKFGKRGHTESITREVPSQSKTVGSMHYR